MPELPEVETIVRGLRPDVLGRTFTAASVLWSREVEGMAPEAFAARVAGQRVEGLARRAKYIVFELSDDFLLVHLRMTGRLYVALPGEMRDADRWLRVTLTMDDGRELRFSDPRKFGRMYLVAQPEWVLGTLGPEPLSDEFTPEAFQALIAGRSGAIKPLLLNQSFIAGVGNIYADEALWRAGIHPQRTVHTLSPADIRRLYHAVRSALSEGIDHEGASVNWYRKPNGTRGQQQNHFNVYGRAGEPCARCGAPISRIVVNQRGTHFCSVCQR